MIAVTAVLAVFGLLCLEVGYRLFLLALFWLAPFWCAIAAAYFVVSLHLNDPLAPFWTFLDVALVTRFLAGRVRDYIFSAR